MCLNPAEQREYNGVFQGQPLFLEQLLSLSQSTFTPTKHFAVSVTQTHPPHTKQRLAATHIQCGRYSSAIPTFSSIFDVKCFL